MKLSVLFCIFCVILKEGSTHDATPVTIFIQTSQIPNTRWEQLIPALQMIKNTTNIKKEKLNNIVKTIKHILIDETDEMQYDLKENIEEERLKEKINESLSALSKDIVNERGLKVMTKEEVNEKLNVRKEIVYSKSYTVDGDEIIKDISSNETKHINKILDNLSAAISKAKKNNSSEDAPEVTKLYKQKTNDHNLFEKENSKADYDPSQRKLNSKVNKPEFTIPCQRASDILEETPYISVPKETSCDLENLNFVSKNLKSILKKLPPGKIIPSSVKCTDTEEIVAMLFKPKNISLVQVYGNLLRQISIKVLVPYHISKFTN